MTPRRTIPEAPANDLLHTHTYIPQAPSNDLLHTHTHLVRHGPQRVLGAHQRDDNVRHEPRAAFPVIHAPTTARDAPDYQAGLLCAVPFGIFSLMLKDEALSVGVRAHECFGLLVCGVTSLFGYT